MICVHCGKEIDNGQAFCPYCGSRVGGDAAPEAKAAKKDPRKLALPVAAVALLAVVGVGLANRMPSIDLQRYVTITAQGYDTLGKLDVSFDTDKLEADYGKRIADSFKKAMNDHKESTYGLSSLAADLYSGSETELFVDYCATGSADKTSGLRNGDVITYSWNESEDEAETLFGVKVKYSDITYTVSGLEKVNTFDAFDGVTVEFNGTAPQGTATVNSLPTAEAGGSLHYTLDTTDGLRNGDTVTLTASSNREDFSDCIEKYGAIPAETEKTFTVSGLNEYVTTPALLTDTVLDSLKAQAEDTFKAYAANHWDTDSESLIGMDYVGDYILTPKEDSFWVDNDIVTLVYKINVHNRYQNFNDEVYEGDNSYYWYISFKNVSVDGSGNVASGLNSYDSAEELGRTIEPHDEYDLAFHQAKPWLEDHKSTPGTAAAKGGRSHASRHHSYGEGLPFPFEGGDITAPFLVGPWERPLNAQAIFPSQIGAAFPREYEHLCPEMPGAELEQGLLHGATRAYPPKELPEMDYASRQPFLKDIQFTKENGGKTKKALDLLSKGLYYATMASSFVVLLMWGGFCGLFGAKSAPFFVLVNMHDGQRDAIAHMFIDRCAHDLKTHRYKPLLAPGIALTLIYLYLEYLSLDPYFWLTRVFRFVYNPLSWICFFLFAGLLVLDAVHAANTYKQYRHLENTIGAAVYFYLFKMARVPGKIGFAVGLMLIMDIFGNYPYLFPIMVTGWLAMQACSKMVTGSADLKY